MDSILKKIDINLLEEVEIDIEELVKERSSKLHDLNILMKKSPAYESNATFDSNIWIFYSEYTLKYHCIDFSKISDMVKLHLIDVDDYRILKCWLVDKIVDDNVKGATLSRV